MPQRNDAAIWSGLFRISAESGQTLQAQIRQAIVAAILDRQIAASMPLPSCRILAEKLGVESATISNFLNRKRGLRLETVDDLCRLLNLRLQHGSRKQKKGG